MIEDSVLQAWAWYCAGVGCLMIVGWRLLRPVRAPLLRWQLLVMLLVLLLCPYSVGEGYTQMAPALLMLMMELVFESGDTWQRVLPTLLGSTVFAMLVVGLLQYWWTRRVRN